MKTGIFSKRQGLYELT